MFVIILWCKFQLKHFLMTELNHYILTMQKIYKNACFTFIFVLTKICLCKTFFHSIFPPVSNWFKGLNLNLCVINTDQCSSIISNGKTWRCMCFLCTFVYLHWISYLHSQWNSDEKWSIPWYIWQITKNDTFSIKQEFYLTNTSVSASSILPYCQS